jgi:hypothetical protein
MQQIPISRSNGHLMGLSYLDYLLSNLDYLLSIIYYLYQFAIISRVKPKMQNSPDLGTGPHLDKTKPARAYYCSSATRHHNSPGPGIEGDIAMFPVEFSSHIIMWLLGLVPLFDAEIVQVLRRVAMKDLHVAIVHVHGVGSNAALSQEPINMHPATLIR